MVNETPRFRNLFTSVQKCNSYQMATQLIRQFSKGQNTLFQTTTESGKIGNDKCYSNTSAKLHLDNLENLFASYISKMHLCDTRNLEDLYDRLLSYIELVLKTKHDLNFLNI